MTSQSIFDVSYNEYDSWFDNKGKIIFENELRGLEFITQKTDLLSIEIGSGTGRFAEKLNIKFGIEPSFNMGILSKKRGVKPIIALGEYLPIKNKTFERVFFIFSVCFINNIKNAFAESYRILKDNGEIIVGFIPSESPLGKKYIQKKQEGHPYYNNAVFYRFSELKKILEKTGFKIIQTAYQMLKDEKKAEKPSQGINQTANFLIVKGQKF